MFAKALGMLSSSMDLVCFAVSDEIARCDTNQLGHNLSQEWGCQVNVTLIPVRQREETAWQHYGAGITAISKQPGYHHYAGHSQIRAIAQQLGKQPDVVFVFGLSAMVALLCTKERPAQMFFDLNDIEHKMRLRAAMTPPFWLGKAIYCTHIPAILAAELQAAHQSRATFVCSDNDARHLRRLGFGRSVTVVPNALPMPEQPPGLVASPTLMFIGSYVYQPNRDAAHRLLTRIWPMVRAKAPQARLIIAGRGGDQIPGAADAAGVEFTGFVDDLAALYARTRIVLCPIATGGGTRIKLIEAASYGRPIVSTRIGAEGLDLGDGTEILLRDNDSDFADACLRLLQDDYQCIQLGTAARAKAASYYEVGQVEMHIQNLFLSTQDTAP